MKPIYFILAFYQSALFANLMVFPTRIDLDQKNRTAHVSVRNRGTASATYKIKLVYYKMKPDGSLELVEDPSEQDRSAYKLVRFSPRSVTLDPNAEQVVRVMVNPGGAIEDGDYRVHMMFEPELPNSTPQSTGSSDDGKITFQLQAKVGVAIPVVFRKGKPEVSVQLSNLKLKNLSDKSIAFQAEMKTTGKAFPYGDLHLTLTPVGQTEAKEIGVFRGVSSYIESRQLIFPLPKEAPALSNGILRLEYRTPIDKDNELIAQTQAAVPEEFKPH